MENLSRRSRARIQTLGLAMIVGMVLSACGSDSGAAKATTTSSGSSYEVVPDKEVTAGLAKVRAFAADIETQAKTDLETAEATYDELHEVWEEIEGTVKANEQESYLDLEDAMGGIKLGVQENKLDRVTSGIAALNSAVDAYLAQHP